MSGVSFSPCKSECYLIRFLTKGGIRVCTDLFFPGGTVLFCCSFFLSLDQGDYRGQKKKLVSKGRKIKLQRKVEKKGRDKVKEVSKDQREHALCEEPFSLFLCYKTHKKQIIEVRTCQK